jgi:uncharacterized protein YndB with AHSA1/START domain
VSTSSRAARELRAAQYVAAPPDRVWAVLSDLSRMPDWSPELVRMVPLRRGGLRPGQSYLGLNRRKAFVWPTRNVVVEVAPGERLSWDTTSSGARWIWELVAEGEGTRVVHRRPVPAGTTLGSRLVAPVFLGGTDEHADELEAGMARTVSRLCEAVLAG